MMTITVGSAGTVVLEGHAVKRISATPHSATTLKLPVKPKGKAKKKLIKTGKAKLTLIVTFTPSGSRPVVKRKTVVLTLRR